MGHCLQLHSRERPSRTPDTVNNNISAGDPKPAKKLLDMCNVISGV
jgi:hypothetical protein